MPVWVLIFSIDHILNRSIQIVDDILHLSFCGGKQVICILYGLLRLPFGNSSVMQRSHFFKALLSFRPAEELYWCIPSRPISREDPLGPALTVRQVIFYIRGS